MQTLAENFNPFIGQKIELVETSSGKYSYKTENENSDVYLKIIEEAKKLGLTTRFQLPGTIVTMEVKGNRLNIYMNNNGEIERFKIG